MFGSHLLCDRSVLMKVRLMEEIVALVTLSMDPGIYLLLRTL